MFQPGGSIRCVLFDAVGTLIRPEPGVAQVYLSAARRFGVAGGLSEVEVDGRFRAAFARQEAIDREAGWATDEIREWRRWEAIVHDVFGEPTRGTGLFEELWSYFADVKNWAVNDPVRAAMIAAREFGLLVGVASNFDARLRRIVSAIAEIGDFTDVFVSSEIGHRKPSAEFFRGIESRLKSCPHQILLIGDDVQCDVEAAQAAGWSAALMDADAAALDAQLRRFRYESLN